MRRLHRSTILLLLFRLNGIHGLVVPHRLANSRCSLHPLFEISTPTKSQSTVEVITTRNINTINENDSSSVFFNSPPQEVIRNGYSMPGKKDGYSAFLERTEPRWMKKMNKLERYEKGDKDMEEDGYGEMQRRKRTLLQEALGIPYNIARAAIRLVERKPLAKEPGTLILVRHGESEWNRNKTFTGWADPGTTTGLVTTFTALDSILRGAAASAELTELGTTYFDDLIFL
jgi:hypothetical protein